MAVTRYVTVAGAGTADGTSWTDAWDMASWQTYIEASAVAGDVYYLYTGTYTLTAALNLTQQGSDLSPIQIIGVSDQSATPTQAVGTDRPTIVCGSNAFLLPGHHHLRNFIVTSSQADGIKMNNSDSRIVNCKVTSSGGNIAITIGSTHSVIYSEIISNNSGIGIFGRDDYNAYGYSVIGCYIHDCDQGIRDLSNSYCVFINNVFSTNATYGLIYSNTGGLIMNNTFYNHDTYALRLHASGSFPPVLNNIFSNNEGTAIYMSSGAPTEVLIDNNDFYTNGVDVDGCTKGSYNLAVDPKFTTPGSDYSLQVGSGCLNAGIDYVKA